MQILKVISIPFPPLLSKIAVSFHILFIFFAENFVYTIEGVLAEISSKTCIKFVKRTTEANWILFVRRAGYVDFGVDTNVCELFCFLLKLKALSPSKYRAYDQYQFLFNYITNVVI